MRTFARSLERMNIIRAQEEHIARFNKLAFPILYMRNFAFRYVKNFVEGMGVNERILIVRQVRCEIHVVRQKGQFFNFLRHKSIHIHIIMEKWRKVKTKSKKIKYFGQKIARKKFGKDIDITQGKRYNKRDMNVALFYGVGE